MKIKTDKILFYAISMAALTFFVMSCKKSDDSDSVYMEGSLSIDLPAYILAGETYTLSVTGITTPTEGVTYKWTTTGWPLDSVIGQVVTVQAPLTIGDYTVQVIARHTDYVSSAMSKATTVLNYAEGGSFSGLTKGDLSFTDSRDGQTYYYNKIGNLYWFTHNLNWAANGKGHPYMDADAISYAYGRLYTWADATGGVSASGLGQGPQGVCPSGWRVPTNEDWEDLAKNLNGGVAVPFDNFWSGLGGKVTIQAYMNSVTMWKYSPDNQQSNMFKWSALPAGNAQKDFSRYRYLREYGFWWTATEKDANFANYRYIYFDNADFPYNYTAKDDFGASVRCVKIAN
jgi:uncharacterized protein (TIGR02145 family)